MLEELKEDGLDFYYDRHKIHIRKGDQFSSDFVNINPNLKNPGIVDHSQDPKLKLFE